MKKGAEARQLRDGFAMLRFEPQLEAAFWAEFFDRRRSIVRIGLLLAVALYLGYGSLQFLGPIDRTVLQTTVLRGIVILSMAATAVALPHVARPKAIVFLIVNYLVFATCLIGIEIITLNAGEIAHYEGMIFICFHAFLFSGLRFWGAAALAGTLVVVYTLGMSLGPVSNSELGFQVFFIGLTMTLGAGAQYLVEHREREAWLRHRELESLATTDIVTGMMNRAAFEIWARGALQAAQEKHDGVCLVLIDLDHFKRVNDRLGHHVGDEALIRVGEALNRASDDAADQCARWGGDEMIALWHCCRQDVLAQRFEKFRESVHNIHLHDTAGGNRRGITVSCGGIIIGADDNQRLEDYLRLADKLLYAAKRSGRDAWRLATTAQAA